MLNWPPITCVSGRLEIARDELDIALGIQNDHSDANYVSALLMLQLNDTPRAERFFPHRSALGPGERFCGRMILVFIFAVWAGLMNPCVTSTWPQTIPCLKTRL